MPIDSPNRYELRKRKAPNPVIESASSAPKKRVRWGPNEIRHFVDEPYEGSRTCFVTAKVRAAMVRKRRTQNIVRWTLGQGPIRQPVAIPPQPPSLLDRCIDFVSGWFQ